MTKQNDDVSSVTINAKTTVHCSPDFSMDLQIYLNPGFPESFHFFADDYISILNKSHIIIMYCNYGGHI